MKSILLLRLCAAAAALLVVTVVEAAEPSGEWTWTAPGRNGGPDRTNTMTLKVEGVKLTGHVASAGRDGKPVETPITEGKVEGDTVSFSVVREFNGNSMTNKYSGKVTADKLTGKMEGGRDGQSRDWEAKRISPSK